MGGQEAFGAGVSFKDCGQEHALGYGVGLMDHLSSC